MPIDDPIISPKGIVSADGDLTSGAQVKLEAPPGTGNLADTVTDAEALKTAVDNLSLSGMPGALAATNVSVDDSGFDNIVDDIANAQDGFSEVNSIAGRLTTIENTAFSSGRAFVRFNDGFTIDRNNIAQFEDRNIIYTARNDKPFDSATRPDVNLPNDAEILASGESYPIVFEFTHLGGSAVFQDRNIVRFFLGGNELQRILRDQVAIVTKPAVGEDYEFQTGGFDPNNSILPNGVFNLKRDTPINNISAIAAELSGLTIVAGDAFLVETGGSWSGFTIPDGSVLVALVNNPSTADSVTNDDWLLLDNPRVNAKSAALLANFDQDGIVFNASRNITIDPSNVLTFSAMATGAPLARQIGGNTTGFNRQIRYDNVPLRFSDLVGGRLQLNIQFDLTRTQGFPPEWISMEILYPDGTSFVFPLDGAPINGQFSATIDIPNNDYSGAIGQDASVRLNYNFRGVLWVGSYTIASVFNTSTGRIHDAVNQVATSAAAPIEMRLNSRIDRLASGLDEEDSAIQSISRRASPLRIDGIQSPYGGARFLDSTGSDAFPSDVGVMSQVSDANPRFTVSGTAVFIAAEPGSSYALLNITQNSATPLDNSHPDVTLGESVTFQDQVYFVYRVTGLTASDVIEVMSVTSVEVVAWAEDIEGLQGDIARIDAELEHAALNLPDEVVHVLDNEVSVTEESSANINPTDFNTGLGDTAAQTVFYEANANSPSGGTLNSRPINATSGGRARRKIAYLPAETTYGNAAYLVAFDGTTGRDLVRYANGVFNAQVFVPANPGGSVTDTVYPAPPNLVAGPGIWQNVPTLTFVNGVPVPEADELFFTRDLPQSATALTIQYRGHANGNLFGQGTATLVGAGGPNEVATTFTLDDGSETATVEVRYYPNRQGRKEIRVSVTERVNVGLPTINDIEVILSYTEARTVPATPATVREVPIENRRDGAQVFAVRPSSTGTLIIVGDRVEVDTNYPYTTLFGASEAGHLILTTTSGVFLDYQDFDPIPSTVASLEDRAELPQYGLFTTAYTRETLLNIGVTIRPDGINVGNIPTSSTGLVSGDLWNDSGTLRIV